MCATHRRIDRSICDGRWPVDRLIAWAGRNDALALIFKLLQLVHTLSQLPLPFLLLNSTLAYGVHSLPVDEVACSWTTCKLTIYTFPVLFEIRLNMLEAVKSRHLTRFFRWWRLATTLPSRLPLRRHLRRVRRLRLLNSTCFALTHHLSILWWILRSVPLILLLSVAAGRVRVMCRVLNIVFFVFHLGSRFVLIGRCAVGRLVVITHLVI